ncbi:WhiB family transcriptional regulator [Rhodococcus aerolatus]
MADYSRLPGPVEDHWTWQESAACRGLQTSMFFHPDYERGPARERRESQAKAVCSSCPVVAQCRSHALQVQEPYGIWGGLSAQERKSLQRSGRRLSTVDTEPGLAQPAALAQLEHGAA